MRARHRPQAAARARAHTAILRAQAAVEPFLAPRDGHEAEVRRLLPSLRAQGLTDAWLLAQGVPEAWLTPEPAR